MGAFHAGHVSLMTKSVEENKSTVVSLFVNPLQFAANEDLTSYPRQEEEDISMAREAGVDVIFIPRTDDLFPRRTTKVVVSEISDPWEGASRPGHFEGVATVVLKLLNIVTPDRAYFGLKDLQQCAVVRRMLEDLNVGVELRLCETVREPSGLAMSSRNAYFSTERRRDAARLFAVLSLLAERLAEGDSVADTIARGEALLVEAGFDVDYLAGIDPDTMLEIEQPRPGMRLIAAARFHGVRLIDNIPVPNLS